MNPKRGILLLLAGCIGFVLATIHQRLSCFTERSLLLDSVQSVQSAQSVQSDLDEFNSTKPVPQLFSAPNHRAPTASELEGICAGRAILADALAYSLRHNATLRTFPTPATAPTAYRDPLTAQQSQDLQEQTPSPAAHSAPPTVPPRP